MVYNLDYYLDKIKTERYARAMRENIVDAISLASRMGGSSGGSSGTTTTTTSVIDIGTEAKYIPYIYANMYDGTLYELNDFEAYEFDAYRKSDALACYIPQYEKFKVTVDIDPNSPELSVSDGIVKLGILCYSSLENQTYEYTLVFDNITQNNLSYTLNNLAGNRQYDSIQIVEKANMGRVHSDSHYGYIVKIELMDPGKFNSKVRYLLQEYIFNQSVTEPNSGQPGRSDLTKFFNPRYNFLNNYKYSYSITVDADGYTPQSPNVEIATLYLYNEKTGNEQSITITDDTSAAQTGSITVTSDYNKIRLEYPTGLDGAVIYPYSPTISMQIYPYSNGSSPLVQEYDITQHESEITGMGFVKIERCRGGEFPTLDSLDYRYLYYTSLSGSGQEAVSIYGEPREGRSGYVHGQLYVTGIYTYVADNITKQAIYKDIDTNERFISDYNRSNNTWSNWYPASSESLEIDGSDIKDNSIHAGDKIIDETIDEMKLDPGLQEIVNSSVLAWGTSIREVNELNHAGLAIENAKISVLLYENAARYFGVNEEGTLGELSTLTHDGVTKRYLRFPTKEGYGFVQNITSIAPYWTADNWVKLDVWNNFEYIPKLCIGFDSSGCVICTGSNGPTNTIAAMNTGDYTLSKVYVSSNITSISPSFYTLNPEISYLYVDKYESDYSINLNLPADSNITVRWRGEFSLSDLFATSQKVLNDRITALENS